MRWLWEVWSLIAAIAVFSYLYARGISPVWVAVAIICFRGFFRFMYKIACLIVTAVLLSAIVAGLIF